MGKQLVRVEAEPLGLPGNLTLTSYQPSSALTFEQWLEAGETLGRMAKSILWWWGDWLVFGEDKWPNRHAQAYDATDYAHQTLYDAAYVSRKVVFSSRLESLSWAYHREVASLQPDQQSEWLERAAQGKWSLKQLRGAVKAAKGDGEPWQNIYLSDSNEWYTPAEYMDSARSVLGDIDLDPASTHEANKTVRAATYYTAEEDGLAYEWPGRVWLNPPWGGVQADFVARLLQQFASGIVTAAILLVNAHSTETTWFQPLWDHTLCFTDHRINFYGSEGVGSTHGSVFIYLGPEWARFADEFRQWGAVLRRVEQ